MQLASTYSAKPLGKPIPGYLGLSEYANASWTRAFRFSVFDAYFPGHSERHLVYLEAALWAAGKLEGMILY